MPRKIKKKKQEKQSNAGKIILITAGIILGIIVILLIVLAIVQNAGKSGEEPSDTRSTVSTSTMDTSITESSADISATESAAESELTTEASIPDFLKDVDIDTTKAYFADIDIKDYGKITVKLDYNAAPVTVRNFVYLADSGFYNGLTFHRIMENFMMQGGDPLGNGTGGSENTIFGEFTANGFNNPLGHERGVISMARNSFDMNSASSQFFIVQTETHRASLDGSYAAFGKVTDGLDIVDKICEEAEPVDDNGTIPADKQPVINSIKIRKEPLEG